MFRTALVSLAAGAVLCAALDVFGLSAAAADKDEKPLVLFDSKDFTGWKLRGALSRNRWEIGHAKLDEKAPNKLVVGNKGEGPGQLVSVTSGINVFTVAQFGDGVVDLEFMVPKGSHSGVFVVGEYAVKILADTYGRKTVTTDDMGGLPGVAAPKVNAARKPGEWQRLVIEYRAPRFNGTTKLSNMKFVKVVLNGQLIHENVEVDRPSPAGVTGQEAAQGAIMLQGDYGPVAFRNIKFTSKSAQ